MTEALKFAVHFSCRHCARVFKATQVHRPGGGSFICKACGTHVHEWDGNHDYTDWESLLPKTSF